MTNKIKKQFGVWMDSHHATIIGRDKDDTGNFAVIGHVKNPGPDNNSNENASNNHEITLTHKFFKEITALMVNIDQVHVTGTGQIQEQFIQYLSETPQYKNTKTINSTTEKMSDEHTIAFFSDYFK